jgi:hypothetical protein
MKTLEYHLPCMDICMYTYYKSHERSDRTIDFEINGTKYIFHYCEACYVAQSRTSTCYYGWFVILMNYIFNECGIFDMYKFKYTDEGHSIACPENVMVWSRNRDYDYHKEMRSNSEYMKLYSDSYNTFYIKRNLF